MVLPLPVAAEKATTCWLSGETLFRALAKAYAGLTALQVEQLLRDKDWMEICHG